MARASGVITLVQEDRFQLAGEDGHKHLFVLSHGAFADIDDLQALKRSQRRVVVRYTPVKDLIAYAATSVVPADGGAR